MQEKYNIKEFVIEQRQHSPNAVILIYYKKVNDKASEQRLFITAPSVGLGKRLGDKMAEDIKDFLEQKYCPIYVKEYKTPIIECPKCQFLQEHRFPMSGKLFCSSCGELLDEVSLDEWKSEQ